MDPTLDDDVLALAAALGIRLLIGAERERRKGEDASRSPAGIRTFALVSLTGALALRLGGELVAWTAGGTRYTAELAPGLALMLGAAWAGELLL